MSKQSSQKSKKKPQDSICEATVRYEKWLSQYVNLEKSQLKHKYVEMMDDPFSFLRATFYRWVQLWDHHAANLHDAPKVLGVGDLHLENFGTWRDVEGRLVWGVNDFDEAALMPFTVDLVRLCASAIIAISNTDALAASREKACEVILDGYASTMLAYVKTGPNTAKPIVLAENNPWLLEIASAQLKDPESFWSKLIALPKIENKNVPKDVVAHIDELMPYAAPEPISWKNRVAGLGSLGRPRYLALSTWNGGHVAREAKALAPTTWHWQTETEDPELTFYREILERAVRSPDPFVSQRQNWIIRRLAPDCVKIRLEKLPKEYEYDLLRAMGRETANIHLGSPRSAPAIIEYLKKQPKDWLINAGATMAEATVRDFDEWCADHKCKA